MTEADSLFPDFVLRRRTGDRTGSVNDDLLLILLITAAAWIDLHVRPLFVMADPGAVLMGSPPPPG